MIIDSLDNHTAYTDVHPRFAKAFEYLKAADLSNLPDGRYEIEGDEMYLTMSRGELRKPEDAPIEAHDRYIDIQLVLEGRETYGWKPRADLYLPVSGFDRAKDIQFFRDAPATCFSLRPGQMAVFFPEDGHAPLIGEGPITKCIVKVLK